MLQTEVHLRSSLSSIPDAVVTATFAHDVHHHGFWPKQLMAVWSLLLQSNHRALLHLSYSTTLLHNVFMTQASK
jgi:hypothetical protein